MSDLHPILVAAAAGRLPPWAVVGDARRGHLERVSELMGAWAEGLGLAEVEVDRWRAVGVLHDALREARPDELRPRVPPRWSSAPGAVLHGPAAAERLRVEGVLDGELLLAIAYHTLGHPDFGPLGRALFAADFVEPGRRMRSERAEEWRARMPDELDAVVTEVTAARLAHRIDRGAPLVGESVAFWNALVGDAGWPHA